MNQDGCFITYFELVDKVKEVVRSNDFIVSDVEKFKKSDKLCYVWIVDEGDPVTTVSRAIQMSYDIKNIEIKR